MSHDGRKQRFSKKFLACAARREKFRACSEPTKPGKNRRQNKLKENLITLTLVSLVLSEPTQSIRHGQDRKWRLNRKTADAPTGTFKDDRRKRSSRWTSISTG